MVATASLRQGVSLAVLLALNTCNPGTSSAADRALVMTISDYSSEAAQLPGVKLDAANAHRILGGIGFAADHVRDLADGQLTLHGMRQALTRLESEVDDGDRVLLYFSGHGTSYAAGGSCEQALVSQDMKPLAAGELFEHLTALRKRASRVVVILDACFSGGIAQRADKALPRERTIDRYHPKFWPNGADSRSCSTPVNVAANALRGLRGPKGAINLERNYVYLAAARDNEVAFDDREKGGLATTAVADCIADGAVDADRSGSISFGELTACAQTRIDQKMPGDDTLRQHLVLAGNDGLPVMAAASLGAGALNSPRAALGDIAQAADGRWDVQVTPSLNRLRVKLDSFHLTVTSSRGGYLYIVYAGSDDKEFLRLYPTTSTEPNVVIAGVPFAVPKEWHSEGPAGTDRLLVMVAQTPRDLGGVFGSSSSTPASFAGTRGIEDALGGCGSLTSPCGAPVLRNLSGSDYVPAGSQSYGATILAIDEIPP